MKKGIRHGLPFYECKICRQVFNLADVIKLENNITGIKGSIVYNILFAVGIIFFINISVILKLLLVTLPVTFLIIAFKKLCMVYSLINRYRDERSTLISKDKESVFNEKFENARITMQNRIA
ncbi:MAG: hypothetical protein A2161_00015 [Candidatus Schekmanbacteria bacterium RBG_13_48_7]|uniref:Uncharacterized protein n=1 Tax=Candidatus Schekmanbacteria bacterium RBG_13_48_7 TaxID=1817878 RepID=A0A1F7RZW4_9BACT|nr:MAG: hypothetical protein A2161_00015 [Candidatus Schekmanbacteria bacterium RBG_13_48_7]